MKRRTASVIAVLLLLTSCGVLSSGKVVLPDPENLEQITVTADDLGLTVTSDTAIAQLLELLAQSVRRDTGSPSVQDIPGERAGQIRIDFCFKTGGASTVFLYWEEGRLFLEQPYQGIYEMDESLETGLRTIG